MLRQRQLMRSRNKPRLHASFLQSVIEVLMPRRQRRDLTREQSLRGRHCCAGSGPKLAKSPSRLRDGRAMAARLLRCTANLADGQTQGRRHCVKT